MRTFALVLGWLAILFCSFGAILAGYAYVTTGKNLQLLWCLLDCALVALNINTVKNIYNKKETNEQN